MSIRYDEDDADEAREAAIEAFAQKCRSRDIQQGIVPDDDEPEPENEDDEETA
jgi:hypothetical protein